MRCRYLFLLGVVFILVGSCQPKVVPASSAGPESVKTAANFLDQGFKKGVIVNKTGLDGCGFMIKLKNGKLLEPNQLDDQFKKEGLLVWVKYFVPKSLNSICMAGQLVNLTAIENREISE